jgi:crotonobetainyl-CoA:carnitine CoA-transferase CaiB-like acyl-CoA transferase
MLSGFSGVIGALTACYARDRAEGGSGRGQHVDVSLFEPILQLLALPLAQSVGPGGPGGPEGTASAARRNGSRIEGGVPRNLYRCRDAHWLALSATTDAQTARLLEVLGRDSQEERERFGTSQARLRVADELDAIVADWISERDRGAVLEACHAARVPVAPVNDLAAILEDPQVRSRASIVSLPHPELGQLSLVAPTPRLSATPGQHRHCGPGLGAHNEEVLGEWLGLAAAQVEALRRAQAI